MSTKTNAKKLTIICIIFAGCLWALSACGSWVVEIPTPNRPTTQANVAVELPTTILTPSQLFEDNADGVFTIYTSFDNEVFFPSGSGFFISPAGLAVTNHHVIARWPYAFILTHSGAEFDIQGYYAYDLDNDIALIQVNPRGQGNRRQTFQYLAIGNSDALRIGESVYAIGSPLGYHNTFSTGIISRFDDVATFGDYRVYGMIQFTAPISGGSSGGALFNNMGHVIGITTAAYGTWDAQSINFAVPIARVDTTLAHNQTYNSLPIGEIPIIYEEAFHGSWVWVGGTYTFNPDGTGSRVWDGIPDTFNWHLSGWMIVFTFPDTDEDEQWLVNILGDNEITIGGAMFFRDTGAPLPTTDTTQTTPHNHLVGSWVWSGGYYTFLADGTGSRDWANEAPYFNWGIVGGYLFLTFPDGSPQEQWPINLHSPDAISVGGATFTRIDTPIQDILVGRWDWHAGWYTFAPDGTGTRLWDSTQATFTWQITGNNLLLDIPNSNNESWAVNITNNNHITIGGAVFTRVLD